MLADLDDIIKSLSSEKVQDQCVLLIGTVDQVTEIFSMRPNLRIHFPQSSDIRLPGLLINQLEEILHGKLKGKCLSISDNAKTSTMNAVARAMISPDFENSRYIDGLVETFHSSVLQKQSLSTNNEGYMRSRSRIYQKSGQRYSIPWKNARSCSKAWLAAI